MKKKQLIFNVVLAILAVLMWVVFTINRPMEKEEEQVIDAVTCVNRLELDGWKPDVSIVKADGSVNYAVLISDAEWIAKVIDCTVRNGCEAQWQTVAWCVVNRMDNPAFPDNAVEVCSQKNQFSGFDKFCQPSQAEIQVAYEVLRAHYVEGYSPCGEEFVYLRSERGVTELRDTFEVNSSTRFWRA